MPIQYNATDYFATAGQCVTVNFTGSSSYASVNSDVPVQRYYISNQASGPVQVKLSVNTTTAVTSASTAGSPQYGIVLGAGDDFILSLGQYEQSQLPYGFTTTAVISAIGLLGTTGTLYVTPVMGA